MDRLGIGTGLNIELTNLLLTKIKVEEIRISIGTNETELSLENNQILLTKI